MYNTLPLHLAHHYGHHILHCIIPHQTLSLALFQTTTFHVTPFIAVSHISYRTSTSRSALFRFCNTHFKSHHIGHIMHHTIDISHCTLFHITDVHIMGHIPCTPRHIQITPYCHIYASHYPISHYITLHSISHAPNLASFHHICL